MKKVLFVALESELPETKIPDDVDIYYTGVGKVNAAMAAASILNWYDLDNTVVVNYGSAGGPSDKVNTLVKCTKFAQGDIDCSPFVDKGITPFDKYEWNSAIINFDNKGELVTTRDQFQLNPQGIVDMEAYSIAKVCKVFGFDFVSYKWISDDGNPSDWRENHNKGIDRFLKILTTT
mgnify:CR=1 FL=1